MFWVNIIMKDGREFNQEFPDDLQAQTFVLQIANDDEISSYRIIENKR